MNGISLVRKKKLMLNLTQLKYKFQFLVFSLLVFYFNCGFAEDLSSVNNLSSNKTKSTPAQLVSLNFQNVPLRTLLQLLAEYGGYNVILSDSINGTMSLHLQQLSWQAIWQTLLRSQGLGERQYGNVLYIAPINEIASKEKQFLQAKQQIAELAPLQSELIQIHYGKASAIATLLKTQGSSLLSDRGNVSVDERTNTIWVEDIASKLNEVRSFIAQLDIPVKQVLIETRIVNIDSDYLEELGVRFGISAASHVSGTLEGANALAVGTAAGDIPLNQRLNIDLPATNPGAASAGIALAKLKPGTLLDLELSAIQSEGGAHIISSPHLLTANQQAAVIESGEEIPYQQATSSGATSITFRKAVLSLNVTPQITPDQHILLTLKVNQDKPSAIIVQGVPAIDTRQIETQVLVDDGQTIVLGGIYEQNQRNKTERVPFLSDIPLLGKLFQYQMVNNKRSELLIFVTPQIVASKNANDVEG